MTNEIMINDSSMIVKAELDIQITTAKAYPRDISKFIENATALALCDEETAESCFYCLIRTDREGKRTEIKGPSIRLAEIAMSCWGNIHVGTRIIENDGKTVTAQAVAWDLEKNVKIVRDVKRSILTKAGKTFSQDMQVITGNAAAAIALRNAIIAIVPKALVNRVYEAAIRYAVGDQKKLSQKANAVIDRFSKLGVDKDHILRFFEKEKVDELTADDVQNLIGIGTAIKEGWLQIDNAFTLKPEEENLPLKQRLDNLLGRGSSLPVPKSIIPSDASVSEPVNDWDKFKVDKL